MSMSQSTPPPAPGQAPYLPPQQPAYQQPPYQQGQYGYPQQQPQQPQYQQPQYPQPQYQQPQQPHYPQPQPQPPRPAQAKRPGLGGALRSEWTKMWSTRSSIWLVALLVLSMVAVDTLLASHYAGNALVDRDEYVKVGVPGAILAELLVVPFGALFITSDYATGVLRLAFTAVPRRSRIITAKVTVLFVTLFVLGTASSGLSLLITHAMIPGNTGVTAVSDGALEQAVLGVGLLLALIGVLAFALGVLLRHSAGTISLLMGVIFLPFVAGIFMGGDLGKTVVGYSLINAASEQYGAGMMDTGPAAATMLYLVAGAAATLLVAAYVAVTTRDV